MVKIGKWTIHKSKLDVAVERRQAFSSVVALVATVGCAALILDNAGKASEIRKLQTPATPISA